MTSRSREWFLDDNNHENVAPRPWNYHSENDDIHSNFGNAEKPLTLQVLPLHPW